MTATSDSNVLDRHPSPTLSHRSVPGDLLPPAANVITVLQQNPLHLDRLFAAPNRKRQHKGLIRVPQTDDSFAAGSEYLPHSVCFAYPSLTRADLGSLWIAIFKSNPFQAGFP
jgi:hypothetical protein